MKNIVILFIIIMFFLNSCGSEGEEFRLDHIIQNSIDEELPIVDENDTDEAINVTNTENNSQDKDNEYDENDGNAIEKIKFWYIIAHSGLRLRLTSDLESEVLANIPFNSKVEILSEEGEEFTIDDKTGKWVRVIWDNKTGWVFGGFLSESPIEIEKAIGYKHINAKSGLRMREDSNFDGKIITTIPFNSKVEILSEEGEEFTIDDKTGKWTKIRWDTKTGWVFSGFLGGYTSEGESSKSWKKVFKDIGPAYDVIQTKDDGFIACGSNKDYYIVKLTCDGKKEWDKKYGGMGIDKVTSILQTKDGGYIVSGTSNSKDILPAIGTNYEGNNFYIIKLNSTGDMEWDAMYVGANEDSHTSIIQTKDNGYLIAGTFGLDNIVSTKGNNTKERDFYFLKLNSEGYKEWDAIYGGNDWDEFSGNIISTQDDGFIVCGYSMSKDINPAEGENNVYISDNLGSTGDMYILKINSEGYKEWDAMYGGTGIDWATSIIQANDDEYIVTGWTESSDIEPDIGENNTLEEFACYFNTDFYILKIDKNGRKIWDAMYNGKNDELAYSISKTKNNDFIITGEKTSFTPNQNTGAELQNIAIPILKIDNNGKFLGETLYGDFKPDSTSINKAYSISQTNDGGFILGGFYLKNNFCILKLKDDGSLENWVVYK